MNRSWMSPVTLCAVFPVVFRLPVVFAVPLLVSLLPPVGLRPARGMTLEVGSEPVELVRPSEPWRYFRGVVPPSAPPEAWKEPGFDDSAWEVGPGGFGYADGDDATVLADMEGNYLTVYIRRRFSAGSVAAGESLELVIDYDDGFVAYLNGQEVARRNMPAGAADYQTAASPSREAGTPERIPLGLAGDLLQPVDNLFAVEGHNVSRGSTDFSLIPALQTGPDVTRAGELWVAGTEAVSLRGTVSSGRVASVRVPGGSATFDPVARTWAGEVQLVPGRNTVAAEALDAGGAVVESATATVLFVPPSQHFGGTLEAQMRWSGATMVDETVTVPEGVVLTIDPGCVVLLGPSASIIVRGQLLASGTAADPVLFTHDRDGGRWGRLMLIQAADSRLAHCVVEYADSEGAHQDYYEPGPRSYHEAVVVIASYVDVEDCLFQKLPDGSPGAEGDAIAVISDDPEYPGAASAEIRRSRFESIGQGVHARFSPVVVEECFFTGKRGDNDDVDLWGESDPPPLIRRNVFLDPEHDDMINPTRCSAVIVENFISGSDDHGIVLRDRGFPVVMNNVIADCASAGIAVENSCEALIANNTIANCGRGIRLFDLGRWGPPYNLNPGGGTAAVVNCIIWDCPQPITLADSSNTAIEDRGSHVTVLYSDIEGGRQGISVSGTASTVTWGEGNIDADPRFRDPAAGDFRPAAGSPVLDAGTAEGAPVTDLDGNPRPCGAAHDMGAHEVCPEDLPRFRRGDANTDGSVDISDAVRILIVLFRGGGDPPCPDSADADDNDEVGLTDAVRILDFLFRRGDVPPAPWGACGPDPTGDPLGCESYPPCG